jgi:hypothetical protein
MARTAHHSSRHKLCLKTAVRCSTKLTSASNQPGNLPGHRPDVLAGRGSGHRPDLRHVGPFSVSSSVPPRPPAWTRRPSVPALRLRHPGRPQQRRGMEDPAPPPPHLADHDPLLHSRGEQVEGQPDGIAGAVIAPPPSPRPGYVCHAHARFFHTSASSLSVSVSRTTSPPGRAACSTASVRTLDAMVATSSGEKNSACLPWIRRTRSAEALAVPMPTTVPVLYPPPAHRHHPQHRPLPCARWRPPSPAPWSRPIASDLPSRR